MKDGELSSQEEIVLRKVLDSILNERGVDFRDYRPKCLWRRIVAAMHGLNVTDINQYLGALKKDPGAYDKLLSKITINVSEFFRNPETFFAVRDKIIPELIKRKRLKGSKFIKIWSAGCATGEEPYSIAILLKEIFTGQNASFQANIYATDIDEEALQEARDGRYKQTALKELNPDQIEKNFIKEAEDCYAIRPDLKANIKFMRHNLMTEPKFNKVDLIFCRNVIIYFNKRLQRQVYENFHKALAKEGYIVAGKVEALMGIGEDLFERVDLSERIFKKKI